MSIDREPSTSNDEHSVKDSSAANVKTTHYTLDNSIRKIKNFFRECEITEWGSRLQSLA